MKSGWVTQRNCPAWISIVRPPSSAIVTGLMAPAGMSPATRMVAPGLAACARADPGAATRPIAPAKLPSAGMDRPSMLPCIRNVRRSMRPEASSSMRSFSTSDRLLRKGL